MDSSDEKTLMESLDPVIVELLKENVRLRGEIDRLKERLDNKKRFFFVPLWIIQVKFNNINIRHKDKLFYSFFQIFLVKSKIIPHAPGAYD